MKKKQEVGDKLRVCDLSKSYKRKSQHQVIFGLELLAVSCHLEKIAGNKYCG